MWFPSFGMSGKFSDKVNHDLKGETPESNCVSLLEILLEYQAVY